MRPHEVYMHVALLDSVPKSGTQRQKIMDFIRSLREHPDTPGDFTDKDASLRDRQIKIIGDYAIIFWLDVPVRAVMVVDVRPSAACVLVQKKHGLSDRIIAMHDWNPGVC